MKAILLKAASPDGDLPYMPGYADGRHGARRSASDIALWLFMGVASMLFLLFIAAYLMRMNATDWSAIGMPWQLWLSTALLVMGSVTLEGASFAARAGSSRHARGLLLAGGMCALVFLGVQLWAWRVLLGNQVMPAGNPAASFFYLLTAMHGLHVIGGLAGWARTAWRVGLNDASWHLSLRPAPGVRAIALCARYWHFLLALWLVLFATLGGVTPAVVDFICGTR
jgi:cytochrome c oxidase subunit III